MKKRMKWFLPIIPLLILLVPVGKKAVTYYQNEPPYQDACALMAEGGYKNAKEILQRLEKEDYKSAEALIQICDAHITYEGGNVGDAWASMELLSKYFNTHYLTDEQWSALSDFRQVLDAELDDYFELEQMREEQEERSKAREGVPYIGMSERYINYTILGRPSSDVRHNYECIGGEQYRANLYDFMDGERVIFTARCVRGQVTEVWDNRNSNYSRPAYRPPTSSGTKEDSDDPYNASDYYDAEDFYDDHYDDFFDFEDAEDYFYAHHDR